MLCENCKLHLTRTFNEHTLNGKLSDANKEEIMTTPENETEDTISVTTNNSSNIQRIFQFILGIGMVAFAVYGWHSIHITGFWMFVLGAFGFSVAAHSVGINLDP